MNKEYSNVIEMEKSNVKDFAKYLIKEIKSLPKSPNGHSRAYDESTMIYIIETRLEDYLTK